MIQGVREFFKTREARKLIRNKSAMIALAVISLYMLMAVAVMCGAITRDSCDQVVGANKLPGFYQVGTPEQRYEIATSKLLRMVQVALGQENPAEGLAAIRLGQARVVDLPVSEIQTLVDQAVAIKDELNLSENLDDDPAMQPKIAELESAVQKLQAPMSFLDQFWQNMSLLLGTDNQGRSILIRGLYSVKIAIQIGLVTATFSVLLGAFLGAAAGYFGGWVDHVIVWIYTTFSSIPSLVLLVVIAYAFTDFNLEEKLLSVAESWGAEVGAAADLENGIQKVEPGWLAATISNLFGGVDIKSSLLPVYIALGATFWIGTCRVIRGETLKLKQMEYVHAAQTAGFGPIHILLKHILPNTAHLMLINFSLLLIGAIKSEVILSFLGLGVKGQPSWGIMIRDAGNNGDVVSGFFWEIGTATVFMFILVLAFNILSDALQDAFDPKHV